jgi:hypothetical protein
MSNDSDMSKKRIEEFAAWPVMPVRGDLWVLSRNGKSHFVRLLSSGLLGTTKGQTGCIFVDAAFTGKEVSHVRDIHSDTEWVLCVPVTKSWQPPKL